MKKINGILLTLLLLLITPLQVFAKPADGLSPVRGLLSVKQFAEGENQALIHFSDMGFSDTNLVSPYDSTRIFFNLPPNWRLIEGGEVEINFNAVLTGSNVDTANTSSVYGGQLTVIFNGQVIGSIQIDHAGSQSVRFAIPPEALQSVRDDGRHQLTISLNAQFSCTYNSQTLITIKSTSLFDLDFSINSPDLTLAKLPAPFFLRGSLLPDKTFLVIPDEPTAGELQAAMNVMAGFGSMIGSEFNIAIASIGSLSNDDIIASNLIFVGKPSNFPQLTDARFPVALADGKFVKLPETSTGDGILEMALSPWNSNKVILLVSGNTDEAVGKASQAFSSGSIFIYDNPTLAYVSDVQLITNDLPKIEDFTLKSIGYSSETLSGVGLNSAEFLFKASKEQVASKDGAIDLFYFHSGVMDYANSSFTVKINDQVVLSNALSEDSEQLTSLQIQIPPGLLRFGENRLTVSARLLTPMSCDTSGFSDPWFIVSDQTSFHLPAATLNIGASSLIDFKLYPGMFTTHSELGDLAFVLPRSSPASWALAGKLAYNLGQISNPLIANLGVVYADDVPQTIKESKSLLFIGRASTLPLLAEVNDKLPAPFDLQSDTASETNMQIVYRIPPGVSVGYLELTPSPFNREKYVLVVAGNTDAGLNMAGNILLAPALRSKLAGAFVVTNGEQIVTTDTNTLFSVVGEIVPNAEQEVVTPINISSTTPGLARPWWLFPAVIVSGLAILLVIGIAMRAATKGTPAEAQKYSEENTTPRNS